MRDQNSTLHTEAGEKERWVLGREFLIRTKPSTLNPIKAKMGTQAL
jgi:hypothetical protein